MKMTSRQYNRSEYNHLNAFVLSAVVLSAVVLGAVSSQCIGHAPCTDSIERLDGVWPSWQLISRVR